MLQTLINAFKVKDIRRKVWMMLLLLLVFRIGCYIPVPGLARSTFEDSIKGNDFLNLMNSITGGSLANGTLFALGIGPYINASIIMQLLCVGIPRSKGSPSRAKRDRKRFLNIRDISLSFWRLSNPSVSSSTLPAPAVPSRRSSFSTRRGWRGFS